MQLNSITKLSGSWNENGSAFVLFHFSFLFFSCRLKADLVLHSFVSCLLLLRSFPLFFFFPFRKERVPGTKGFKILDFVRKILFLRSSHDACGKFKYMASCSWLTNCDWRLLERQISRKSQNQCFGRLWDSKNKYTILAFDFNWAQSAH